MISCKPVSCSRRNLHHGVSKYLFYCTKNQGTKHENLNTAILLDSIPHPVSLPVAKSSSFPDSKTLAGPLDPYNYDVTPVARCSFYMSRPSTFVLLILSSHLRVYYREVLPHTLAPFHSTDTSSDLIFFMKVNEVL